MRQYRKISELRNWDKNPRSIKKPELERLKEQITTLGQYKPLLITPDGVVLGGNMRLMAMKELGIEECWVNIVEPKNEKEKLEYALEDNDIAGFTDKDKLMELATKLKDFPLNLFKVDLGKSISLEKLVNQMSITPTIADPEFEEDLGGNFEDAYIKKIIIIFGEDDYKPTLDRLQGFIREVGLRNNTEAVYELLKRYGK